MFLHRGGHRVYPLRICLFGMFCLGSCVYICVERDKKEEENVDIEGVAEIERMTQAIHVAFFVYGIVVIMSTPRLFFLLAFVYCV